MNIFQSKKATSSYLVVLYLVLLCTIPYSQAKLVDKVVAVVNNDVITLSELNDEVSQNLLRKGPADRETVLDGLITQHLVNQKAKQLRISVKDSEIENAISSIRLKQDLSQEEFYEKLKGSGMTPENYKRRIRYQILQTKVVGIDVRSKVIISDEMVKRYYDKNYTTKVTEGSYYLLQIGITWNQSIQDPKKIDLAKEQTRKQAQRILVLAQDGEDFKTLAKKFSDLPSASDGGDIGVFTLDEMATSMRDAISPLEPGEISTLVETQAGYQFFKLISKNENSIVATKEYEKVKKEIKEKLFKEELNKSFSLWVQELKDNAYIQKL